MRRVAALVLALPLAIAAREARLQDAQACVNEVRRLVERFPLDEQGEQARPIAGAAGARKNASLTGDQRRAIGQQIEEARASGEQGDGAACIERLNAARTALREGGLGGIQPGMATGGGPLGGTGGGGASSGSTGQSPDAIPGLGGAGSHSDGSLGGGTTGSSGRTSGGGRSSGGGTGGGGGSSGGGGL
jgi:hypothetical protein